MRTDSGVEIRRSARIVRTALLRQRAENVARIMYIVSRGRNDSWESSDVKEGAFKCVCLRLQKMAVDIIQGSALFG